MTDLGFGEVDLLQEVFGEAEKMRRGRHPAHVLVVEDDPLTRRIITCAFGDSHVMISEENAHGAVASYLLHAPDIVFLDIGLPGLDGFNVLDQILMIDTNAFVVMISSHDDRMTIDKALLAGAKGFISKPFKKETLRSYIQLSAVHHRKSHH